MKGDGLTTASKHHQAREKENTTKKRYSHKEWAREARRRFGTAVNDWKFVCPSCGHVTRVRDWQEAGAPEEAIAFSCVGRWTSTKKEMMETPDGPCNYAGGGLFLLNPVLVDIKGKTHAVFNFAD